MDAGPHAGVEKDVFSCGWNSFSRCPGKTAPNPMSKLMQPSPAYPIPSLMSSPRSSLRPPTPHHTTNIHQPPTFSILQYPSVPPAHPSCAHKVQEHEAQLEQCKATGKAEKDATKGIKDLQKNAIRVFLDPTPTSGFSKADLRNLAPPRGDAGSRVS